MLPTPNPVKDARMPLSEPVSKRSGIAMPSASQNCLDLASAAYQVVNYIWSQEPRDPVVVELLGEEGTFSRAAAKMYTRPVLLGYEDGQSRTFCPTARNPLERQRRFEQIFRSINPAASVRVLERLTGPSLVLELAYCRHPDQPLLLLLDTEDTHSILSLRRSAVRYGLPDPIYLMTNTDHRRHPEAAMRLARDILGLPKLEYRIEYLARAKSAGGLRLLSVFRRGA